MAVIRDDTRGTLLAVEKPTMISPEACAANDPTRPMPSAARLHTRTSCDDSSGASVATTTMMDPAFLIRRSEGVMVGSSSSPTGTPSIRSARMTPKLDCTSTPSVYSPVAGSVTRRELVPMPALKSQVIMPVPAPPAACSMAR